MRTLRPTHGAPEAPAAWDEGGGVRTYAELHAAARGVEHQLPRGADVLVLCEDRYWFAAALLGAWQRGCRVTLPPHRGSTRVAELVAAHVVLHDGEPPEGARGFDVREVARAGVAAGPLDAIPEEEELLVLYTSGSTGEPTRWVKRARQILGEAAALAERLSLDRADRVLPTVAPQHIYGLLFGVLAPLAAGGSFARSTPLHAEAIGASARRLGASVLVSVPAHLEVLVRLLESRPERTEGHWSVRRVVSSGAVLAPEVAKRLRRAGVEVLDVLGSTETGGLGVRRTGLEELWTPLPGVRVAVDEEERLVVCSPFLVEPAVAHATGDRGWVAEDGCFGHLGRADGVAKVGGKRVSLGEVEAAARAAPQVRDAVALRQPVGGLRGEEIWLVAVAPGSSAGALRAALRQTLDPLAVPRRIRLVSELPRDARGKLSRERLLALFPGAVPAAPRASEGAGGPRELSCVARGSEGLEAVFDVPEGWRRFEGHFPGDPLLPAVSQIVDLVLPPIRRAWPELAHLERVSRLKFLAPLRPGERVAVALERSLAKVAFELRGRQQVLARGTLTFHRSP